VKLVESLVGEISEKGDRVRPGG